MAPPTIQSAAGLMGELVYDVAPWKIYRQDAGMGEKEYRIFLNDVNFCVCDHEITAKEIITAMRLSAKARWCQ